MKKRYIIRLTDTERQASKDLVHKGKGAAYRRTHAQIILLADESDHGAGLGDAEIAEQVDVHQRTVSRDCVSGAWNRGFRQRLSGNPASGNGHGCWMEMAKHNWSR